MELKTTIVKGPLELTGQLAESYAVNLQGRSSVLGFAGTRRRDASGKSSKSSHGDVADGLEEKYGDIFGPTTQELANADIVIDDFLDNLFK